MNMDLTIDDYVIGKTLGVGSFCKVKSFILIQVARHITT